MLFFTCIKLVVRVLACVHAMGKIAPMEYLSNEHKDHPNQHKNSHKLYSKTGHPVLSLMESQQKLTQQHDQNFPMVEKPF